MKRILGGICVLALVVGLAGCTKMRPEPEQKTTLEFLELAQDDSIPAEYGKLISVTTTETYPGWAQLWFEKPDGTIVTVFVKFSNGTMRQTALTIKRT